MAVEIERKFLVRGDFMPGVVSATRVTQGYICSAPGRTVRVRVRGGKGYLTIKGASDEKGMSRYEFEREIPLADAERLVELCEPGLIDKTRYLVPHGGHTWEVDVFHGANEGLILAEIELSRKDEPFDRPAWLGEEVTGDRRYYNSMLTKRPFSEWSLTER